LPQSWQRLPRLPKRRVTIGTSLAQVLHTRELTAKTRFKPCSPKALPKRTSTELLPSSPVQYHSVRLLQSANARPFSLICHLVEKPPGHSPSHPPHHPADRLPSCSPDSPAGCSRSRLPESPDSRLPNRSPGCPDSSSLNRSPDSLQEHRPGSSPHHLPHHPPRNPPDCFPGHAWSHPAGRLDSALLVCGFRRRPGLSPTAVR
jgi:hypothetical protein